MPYFKTDIFFQQFNKSWSETWNQSGSTLGSVSALFTDALLQPFVQLRHRSVTLYKVRVSSVDNNRASTVLNYALTSTNRSISDPAVTGLAAQVNFAAPVVGVSRKLEMRGLNQVSINRDPNSGKAMPASGFLSGLDQYIKNIINNLFLVRAKIQIANPAVPPNSKMPLITLSASQNAGFAVLTFVGTPTLAVGSIITINRVDQKQFPGLKGLFYVSASGPGTVTVAWNSPDVYNAVTVNGYCRQVSYQYGIPSYVGSDFVNFTTRDTGKNSTGGRGARPAQRLRLAR